MMPFDPIDFEPHRPSEPLPERGPPRITRREEDTILLLVIGLAVGALVLPIGGSSIVQAVAYLLR